MERKFAVIENNKVVNIIINIEDEVVAANPEMYIEYTDGWDFDNGIDGGDFFIKQESIAPAEEINDADVVQ
jgi:hypothetical protein